jgi:hypothetical protein
MSKGMNWERAAKRDRLKRAEPKPDPVLGSRERTSERREPRPSAGKQGTGLPWEYRPKPPRGS